MSRNPFLEYQGYETKPNRNNYDRTRRNFFTGKLGCEIPVFVDEVNSGDSFQINPEFLLNFFPMPFPVQTPMRASVQFYYVKNRGLQKNWPDFLYSNKQITPPYISKPQGDFWHTGTLADYLGVPTTYSRLQSLSDLMPMLAPNKIMGFKGKAIYQPVFIPIEVDGLPPVLLRTAGSFIEYSAQSTPSRSGDYLLHVFYSLPITSAMLDITSSAETSSFTFLPSIPSSISSNINYFSIYIYGNENGGPLGRDSNLILCRVGDRFVRAPSLNVEDFKTMGGLTVNAKNYLGIWLSNHPNGTLWFSYGFKSNQATFWPLPGSGEFMDIGNTYFSQASGLVPGASLQDLSTLDVNPFADYGDGPAVPISAFPFRAYEQIHNVYSRDPRIDPFVVDGEVQYNKFVTNDGDGADSTDYHLYFRRWEPDFLTTALPSPQQGLAPLVGITMRGDMRFRNDDGTESVIRPILAEDGETPTGIAGVLRNGTPEALRAAQAIISQGISINDFRNVNALQRWVENNYRRGLRYADQVLANTGVRIKYDELDLPEYLGGFSRPVQVTQITQSTPSTASDNALGDRAGQASVYGGAKHMIRRYCDEAGFIIGIFTITPQPVYTQLLPKYFLKSDPLSYFHPVFGHIGPQPITYREVCPIQCLKDGGDLDAVFGYQRPYYDLLAAVDEAHGNMRMSMRDMLMQRTFTGVPELGRDFITIDPEQLNQVFTSTDGTEDVFQGQIVFNDYVKRAIPRFGQPRIEP